jgi:hypothetical protein
MLNRNIVTNDDMKTVVAAKTRAELPKTFDVNPPAVAAAFAADEGRGAPGLRGPHAQAAQGNPGGVATPSGDDYMTKLLKYVPVEVLGFYLLLAGVIDSNVTKPHDHAIWLLCLLIGTLVLTALYDYRVLNVVRMKQIAVSVLGLAVYVFAAGGWFATTTWYQQWYASIAVPVFALLVGIIKLKPLPPVGDQA